MSSNRIFTYFWDAFFICIFLANSVLVGVLCFLPSGLALVLKQRARWDAEDMGILAAELIPFIVILALLFYSDTKRRNTEGVIGSVFVACAVIDAILLLIRYSGILSRH